MFKRRSIRLKEYDYGKAGWYFVTIDLQNCNKIRFGEIENGKIELNKIGKMIKIGWQALENEYKFIKLDEYVIMPNHLHGILAIENNGAPTRGARTENQIVGAGLVPALPLGSIIGAFKSISTNQYIAGVKLNHWPRFQKRLWQRDYYEMIIRNEGELKRIREYIKDNPKNF